MLAHHMRAICGFQNHQKNFQKWPKFFLDKNQEDFCQQAFGKFSVYFGQLAGNF